MNKKEFHKVIDFAIKREEGAVAFYVNLKNIVYFKEKQDLLETLVEMERVHIEVLESIRLKTMKHVLLPRLQNLDVEAYSTDEIIPNPDMSYRDILRIAIQREEQSFQLYQKLARECADDDLIRLFKRLAAEEVGHKIHFERLIDEPGTRIGEASD
jgi:rubrerythrin